NSGNFRGDITGASGTFEGDLVGGELHVPDTGVGFHVDDTGDLWIGATEANKATAPFSVDAATGDVVLNDATIEGSVIVEGSIESDDYSAASAGWIISDGGTVEFNDATLRGTVEVAGGAVKLNDTGITLPGYAYALSPQPSPLAISSLKWTHGSLLGSVASIRATSLAETDVWYLTMECTPNDGFGYVSIS